MSEINEQFKEWKQNYKCDDSYDHGYNIRDMQAAFLAGQEAEREAIGNIVEGRMTTISVYATIVEAMVVTAFKRDILAAIKARGRE